MMSAGRLAPLYATRGISYAWLDPSESAVHARAVRSAGDTPTSIYGACIAIDTEAA